MRIFYPALVDFVRYECVRHAGLLLVVVTILCHALANNSPDSLVLFRRASFPLHTVHTTTTGHPKILHTPSDAKPIAVNDFAETPEETPVTINLLLNDREGEDDDDNDDDDNDGRDKIDPRSIDLDPATQHQDEFLQNSAGGFVLDNNGNLTFDPAQDFTGPATIQYTVRNRDDELSDPASVHITVIALNDAPTITGQSPDPIALQEDGQVAIGLENLVVTDPDNAYPTGFTLSVGPGENYTVSGSVVTPAANYAGSLTVPVFVNDGQLNSNTFNLQLNVTAVNDPPQITGQVPIVIGEEQSLEIAFSHLIVTDVDSPYPTGFSLLVGEGANYSVLGSTITPVTDFSGSLTVPVTVNDGQANSNTFPLAVQVSGSNDAPVITGQTSISMAEDNSITIMLSDLFVSDNDNNYPEGFALRVLAGEHYTFSGTTITPSPDYAGTLSVPVIVNDGANDSAPFNLQVVVNAVNDPPLITGQSPLATSENQPVQITLAHLMVVDPDNAYPTGFFLTVLPGDNYSAVGSTITPDPGFDGTLSVGVYVNDGAANSNIFPFIVTVSGVNDPPVITGQNPLSVAEDNAIAIRLVDLIVADSDNPYPSGFTITVSPGTNYIVSGNTVTPVLNFYGTLGVGVQVSDGNATSAMFMLQVTVTPVNDPPVITGQSPVPANEDEAFALFASYVAVADPDNVFPTDFSLIVAAGANYTASGNVVTPSPNFYGILSVNVAVSDGASNSPLFPLQVTVNPVNDAPFFETIPAQTISENAGEQRITIRNISTGPAEGTQQLTLIATSANAAIIPNPAIEYNGSGASAVLIFSPTASASGTTSITVTAVDNGPVGSPHVNTYTSSFQVTINPINNQPTLAPIADVSVPEDAGIQNILLTEISAGAGETQTLTVTVSAEKPALFEILQVAYTSPQATGQLQVKPAANVSGVSKITVTVVDDGPANGPNENTISRTFSFAIQPINDPPVFVSAPVTLAAVNEPYVYNIEIADTEGKSHPFSAPMKPVWLNLTGSGPGKARLSGTPPTTAVGSSAVTVQVTDGELVVPQTFSVFVNTRPTATGFTVSVTEDQPHTFGSAEFQQAYTDADQHALSALVVTSIPVHGQLRAGTRDIAVNDTIVAGEIGALVYHPAPDYAGEDKFTWKVFDGYHTSATGAATEVFVSPVNDPPVVIIETDSLLYEVNGEQAQVTALFAVHDPDSDSLKEAEVTFRAQNFEPEADRLFFHDTEHIRGTMDFQAGKLKLSGLAPLDEYEAAIRSIQYQYLNTVDPSLGLKTLSFVLNDGHSWGEPKDRAIALQYTFVELEIPSGFTPNGDHANDTWVISRPGGVDQLEKAEIKVFNKRGVQVFFTEGFGNPWDGTMQGQLLPADSYFYTIDLKLKNKKTYRGVVTILR